MPSPRLRPLPSPRLPRNIPPPAPKLLAPRGPCSSRVIPTQCPWLRAVPARDRVPAGGSVVRPAPALWQCSVLGAMDPNNKAELISLLRQYRGAPPLPISPMQLKGAPPRAAPKRRTSRAERMRARAGVRERAAAGALAGEAPPPGVLPTLRAAAAPPLAPPLAPPGSTAAPHAADQAKYDSYNSHDRIRAGLFMPPRPPAVTRLALQGGRPHLPPASPLGSGRRAAAGLGTSRSVGALPAGSVASIDMTPRTRAYVSALLLPMPRVCGVAPTSLNHAPPPPFHLLTPRKQPLPPTARLRRCASDTSRAAANRKQTVHAAHVSAAMRNTATPPPSPRMKTRVP